MPRLSANIGILFREHDFLDRFAAAARAGFAAVECWAPYEHSIEELRGRIEDAGIPLIGINTAMGSPGNGDMGWAGLPGREGEFDAAIAQALEYGTTLEVNHIHVMAGAIDGFTEAEGLATFRRNLGRAAARAEAAGVTLVIEPVNRRDRPSYLLSSSERAAEIIDVIASPSLKMMFDFYHLQIMEGDVITRFEKHLPRIGHVQIASVPTRGEPDEGELDYAWILREIDQLGWSGYVGCEYHPRGRTEEGLAWREKLGLSF
jgi:2-dehydrotetronate isomerase